MNPDFIHLRVHTEYSLVDGIVKIKALINSCQTLRYPAVALTDQNNFFGLVKFYSQAQQAGIKPIVGVDVWLKDSLSAKESYRCTLLCMNNQGYRRVTEIISQAYQQGQVQGAAYVLRDWLKQATEGVIVLSGGHLGDVGKALVNNQMELAERYADFWQTHFADRYYLEVSRTGRVQEEDHLHHCVDFADRHYLPIVATNDVRFIDKTDFDAHEARVCINQSRVLADKRRPRDYTNQQYLRSPEEMMELFSDLPEALENTVEIAKRCNVTIQLGEYFLPDFPVPKGLSIEEYFCQQSELGLEERLQAILPQKPPTERDSIRAEYFERLKLELDVINQMGFPGYFLIVADFIQWSKNNGIPVGPGRGSGAGSLVAYALKITDLDPIPFDLLFERFLNPERVSMPDFDVDFCMDGRDRVIDYVAEKYHRDSVSQIITFGTMAAKAVVRDVGRVLGKPYGFCDRLAKLIPFEIGMTLAKAFEQEEAIQSLYESDDEVREVWDLAVKLEGITRNAGKHAGGVVIAPSKLTDFTALYCDEAGAGLVSQLDKDDVESVGLVKFDFLGLRTLTIIDWALESINARKKARGEAIVDITHIPDNDDTTFKLLKRAQTTAVFQLESRGMKELIKRLQPSCFEDIVALVALFRPGPLGSGMVDDFINRKHGREVVKYPHPSLENVLKPTYGTILYQEQVMQIAQVLAGFSLGSADLLRRAMGKKKAEVMEEQGKLFVEGATANGVDPKLAQEIFDLMAEFAKYGFNKSHSAAYALVSYQTAWLKAHYPEAFMAAVMSADMDNTDKVVTLVEECADLGITIRPPDVNSGEYKFSVSDDDEIIYGIGAIKGVGEGAILSIVTEREQKGAFKDLFDFCHRIDGRKVNRRVLESLIRSGALDSLGPSRAVMMASLDEAIKRAEQSARDKARGQLDLFGLGLEDDTQSATSWKPVQDWSEEYKLQGEKETLGLYLSGHPIEQYAKELRRFIPKKINELSVGKKEKIERIAGLVVNVKHIKTKSGNKIGVVTLDDKSGRIEVSVFGETYSRCLSLLAKDTILVVEGEVANSDFTGGLKMSAREILEIESAREIHAKELEITIQSHLLAPDFCDVIKDHIEPFRAGACPIVFRYEHPSAWVTLPAPNDWRVRPSDELMARLRQMKGCHEVAINY